jgi:hypothetical protein
MDGVHCVLNLCSITASTQALLFTIGAKKKKKKEKKSVAFLHWIEENCNVSKVSEEAIHRP